MLDCSEERRHQQSMVDLCPDFNRREKVRATPDILTQPVSLLVWYTSHIVCYLAEGSDTSDVLACLIKVKNRLIGVRDLGQVEREEMCFRELVFY